jgi:hypothetical protein
MSGEQQAEVTYNAYKMLRTFKAITGCTVINSVAPAITCSAGACQGLSDGRVDCEPAVQCKCTRFCCVACVKRGITACTICSAPFVFTPVNTDIYLMVDYNYEIDTAAQAATAAQAGTSAEAANLAATTIAQAAAAQATPTTVAAAALGAISPMATPGEQVIAAFNNPAFSFGSAPSVGTPPSTGSIDLPPYVAYLQ